MVPLSINISGKLMSLDTPKIMGILNVTPDSFYAESRTLETSKIRARVRQMLSEGVDIIDVGGCSTRPGSTPANEDEEWERVEAGCRIVRELAGPEFPLSIDTFRAEVAREAIEGFDAQIINDVSGGDDPEMWPLLAESNRIYVLTDNDPHPSVEQQNEPLADLITRLSWKVNSLHRLGINDVIIDPGFGFAKTISENFTILGGLEAIVAMGYPVLAGISRKSMIYKSLDISPAESLPATIALNAAAILKGAHILRVHDVAENRQAVNILAKI